jgi:RNA polymerase sigma-70 factor (ECF subfamily)
MNHPNSGGESTLDLLVRVRAGDARASDELVERYLPELRRWTSGRLPLWARHAVDTDDLIQDTLIEVFRRINTFEYRGDGALLAYLRQALMNRIRNQIRAAGRRPPTGELDEQMENAGASPLEAAIGSEALVAYDTALEKLQPADREAIVARIELGLTYPELALALNKPSPDAARMAVTRALVRLTGHLRELGLAGVADRSGGLD